MWEAGDERDEWTVGRLMVGYLASIDGKTSHGRRQDAWKAMRGFWQDVDPAMIDEPMVASYRAGRAVSDATARYELMQLSTALGWGVRNGKIAAKRAISLPPVPERKERHLSRSEFRRFLEG